MTSDDEVLHLFEAADPARVRDAHVALDAASYLEALRARRTEVTLVEIGPVLNRDRPARRHGRSWVFVAAAAAAVALVAGAVLLDTGRDDKTDSIVPAGPGPAPTSPAPPQRDTPGFPPESMPPSLPETGELLVGIVKPGCLATEGRRLFLYADGRLIAAHWSYLHPTGFDERRLTPEGVGLVVAEVISTGLFQPDGAGADGRPAVQTTRSGIDVRNGDDLVSVPLEIVSPESGVCVAWPEEFQQVVDRLWDLQSWLPPSGWEDAQPTPYVPRRYSVCMLPGDGPPVDEAAVLALPGRAGELLGAGGLNGIGFFCAVLTTEEAREVARALDAAKLRFGAPPLEYLVDGLPTGRVVLFRPYLPHGVPGECCGGIG